MIGEGEMPGMGRCGVSCYFWLVPVIQPQKLY
jgi:hypothetical protein